MKSLTELSAHNDKTSTLTRKHSGDLSTYTVHILFLFYLIPFAFYHNYSDDQATANRFAGGGVENKLQARFDFNPRKLTLVIQEETRREVKLFLIYSPNA